MAKRKQDMSLPGQLDMFGEWIVPQLSVEQPISAANDYRTEFDQPTPANAEIPASVSTGDNGSPPRTKRPKSENQRQLFADEWWTLGMVCAYLKVGRKAVWERKRDTRLGFPKSVCLGSNRPRWRSNEVRDWANQYADEEDEPALTGMIMPPDHI